MTTANEHERRMDIVFDERRDPLREFEVAARHSRRVRLLKIAIPAAGAAVVLVALVVSALRSFSISVPLGDLGRLVLSGSKLTMEAPRLSGFTKDNRGYEVSAKSAQQDVTRPHVIELDDLFAKLDLADKGWARMNARRGSFDAKTELLTLGEGIFISTSQGYEGKLWEAKVDVRAGTIVSDKPVELNFLRGTLNANTLQVRENGQVMRFDGGVSMTVMLPQSQGTAGGGATR